MPSSAGVARRARALFDRVTGAGRRGAVVQVEGAWFVVPPGVFDPVRFRSGALLARVVGAEVRPGQRVLDLGCGAGAAGVTAAKRGASVIATDVNAAAVGAARGNAWLAGVSVDAREGDLFVPVIGERFDLVLFNPPFFDDAPPPPGLDARAWRGVGVFERFVAGLRDHLAPGGAALVVASTDGGGPGWPGALRAAGFDVDVAGSRAWPDETVDVLRVR